MIAGLLAVALLAAPLVLPRYHVTLLLPSFAYGIALLGLNLLFGTTGLLSFGHALFVALGAYTAAFLTTGFGVLHLELDPGRRRPWSRWWWPCRSGCSACAT